MPVSLQRASYHQVPMQQGYIPIREERSPKRSAGIVKSKKIALLFWFFCGIYGAHNLYLGRVRRGVFLLTAPWILTVTYIMLMFFMRGLIGILVLSALGFIFPIFILGIFINWIIELFQILSGRIVDDYGRMIQLK